MVKKIINKIKAILALENRVEALERLLTTTPEQSPTADSSFAEILDEWLNGENR